MFYQNKGVSQETRKQRTKSHVILFKKEAQEICRKNNIQTLQGENCTQDLRAHGEFRTSWKAPGRRSLWRHAPPCDLLHWGNWRGISGWLDDKHIRQPSKEQVLTTSKMKHFTREKKASTVYLTDHLWIAFYSQIILRVYVDKIVLFLYWELGRGQETNVYRTAKGRASKAVKQYCIINSTGTDHSKAEPQK